MKEKVMIERKKERNDRNGWIKERKKNGWMDGWKTTWQE